MSPSNSEYPPMHPIEEAILGHIDRYETTTAEASFNARVRGMTSIEIARNRLDALVRRKVLRREPLFKTTPCYSRNKGSQAAAGTGEQADDVLSIPEKLRRFAMLQFCTLHSNNRNRLTREEMSSRFSDLYRENSPVNYYVSNDDSITKLGFLRVDLCGHGRWDRIVSKLNSDLHWHLQHRTVKQLLSVNAFEMTVVTALWPKARRIESALAEKEQLMPIPVRVIAMPEFISIIRPPPD
jgi:hypothetical protein